MAHAAAKRIQAQGMTFDIEPEGPFSLYEAATFGFGQRHDDVFDGTMRLAFCVDGYRAQAGVAVTQGSDGVVHATITAATGEPALESVRAQVARVLSLDKDARGFVALGQRDPVLAQLLAAAPGLRPPLFYSPYEAALWAVLSARRPRRIADGWRRKLSVAVGAGFDVAGQAQWSVPLPRRLLAIGAAGIHDVCGVELLRAQRMLAVAEAATQGKLCATTLAGMEPESARAALRTLPGIGPFYADLILIRATGVTDLLSTSEPRLLALLGELYGNGEPATPARAAQLAANWTPWRTWAAVLVRAAGSRVLKVSTGMAGTQ
jgi:DNA-3-methyladenine glycosylase II